ncbi:MAG TPA: VCBS repeat-containing protein, partial [Candidatus Handelsmanbacteria bacterium]|nr:VCBS repeat-containing protein [Candidatus Handelsmanbacteria bacterium]
GLGRGLGLALSDVDLDGDTDLYIANDGTANFLYRNHSTTGGEIRVEEVGLQAGVHFSSEGRAEAGMGTDFGDIDGDGWPDLVVTNFSRETNTLYRHTGSNSSLVDDTIHLGLAQPSFMSLGFGAAFFDADGDGDLDMYTPCFNKHLIHEELDAKEGVRSLMATSLTVPPTSMTAPRTSSPINCFCMMTKDSWISRPCWASHGHNHWYLAPWSRETTTTTATKISSSHPRVVCLDSCATMWSVANG